MTDNVSLAGRRIAVPEARQLDLFAEMLEARGAAVMRCPLVDIRDAPDPAPVEAWLRAFADGECHDLILLTGEGLKRLLGFAERADGGLRDAFVARLSKVRKIVRGPKPGRVLRELGLRPDLPADAPTTDGVIAALAREDLRGRTIGVQLYGTDPNDKLMGFLAEAGASARPVAPYVYADASEDARVIELIEALASGNIDAIAFTSSPQVKRLFAVARKHEMEEALQAALDRIVVAAVGPLVADTLRDREVTVDLMPQANYFMKPLVRELVARLGPPAPAQALS